jgi:hypothetical protein
MELPFKRAEDIMSRKTYHITYQDGKWKGKLTGAERSSATGPTKEEVVKRTIDIAKKQGTSQVVIHNKQGKIQEERTYGSDPFPPKG